MTITGTPASRDVVTNPYVAGDPLPYSLTVRSTSNVQTNSVPTASNLEVGFLPPSAPNCRYLKLAAGASYTCTPSHQLTTDEIARGWFRPTATFEVTSTADATATRTVTFTGAPVVLRDPLTIAPTVDISGSRSDASRDLSTMPYTVGEQVPYSFRVVSTTPYIITVTPASGPFGPFVPPGTGNCRWSNLAALGAYTCATPRHTVTQDELDAGFFVADTGWTLSASGRASVAVPVAGGEVDLKVRAPELAGTVTPVWVDVDGDRYASVGDQVVVTRTLGNAGTTSLTGVVAPGGLATPALALEQSVTDTVTLTLDAAMLQSPTLVVDGFTATAANGSRSVSLTVDPVTFALDHKPSMPTSSPTITRVDYTDLVPPVELGLDQKYRIGSEMVLQNLPYGQWYHLSLNKNSQDLGWFFTTVDDEISVILPQGTKNGRDDVVVRLADGSTYTWGTYIVTPKG